MKRTFLLFSILTTILFTSCDQKREAPKSESSIYGYFDNVPGEELTLAIQTPEGLIPLDTIIIENDGYFEFNTSINEMALYRVILDYTTYLTIAAQKGDHIYLEADGTDVYDNYYLEGSEESELIRQVIYEALDLKQNLDSIQIEINHQKSAKNAKALIKSFDEQKALYDDYHTFSLNFIDMYPGSLAAYFVVTKLQIEEDPEAYLKVAAELSKKHPNFSFVSPLLEQVKPLKKTKVGQEAPELNFPSPTGQMISTKALKGSFVLIDFWASWCKPCRAENPNLKLVYSKYKNENFEIYGYSLDDTKDRWVNAIEEDDINWIHTSDLQGWQAKGAISYGVNSIPASFLLDPEGTIIARNLRGADLEHKLFEIFGY